MAADATLASISPFFIVDDLAKSAEFYTTKLGFAVDLMIPEDDPFFAIVRRDAVRILLKQIAPEIKPVPNYTRHEWARWDALIICPDPDAIAAELARRGIPFHEPLADTEDGLRAFEIKDADGYVLCFARPL